jgi:flagellar M-ring protein FliF
MDFVNKSYSQVAELFRSMTPAGRITTGLLLAVVVASFMFLFRYRTDQADEYLFGGEPVTQGELVAIEAAFGKANLSNYEILGNKVRVPRLQRATYLAALGEGEALPQNFGSASKEMLASDSPFDTRDIRERKARFAQEKELAKIVRAMPDIQDATVTIQDMPAPAFGAAKERRALVAVKSLGTRRLDDSQVKTIRQTVASGSGVKPEYVTVTDLNGSSVSPGVGQEHGASEHENVYAANQKVFIDLYTQQIRERLSTYPGIQVAVYVELDKDLQNQTSSHKYDDKPTSIQSTEVTKESSSSTGENGGRVGAVPNGAAGTTPSQVATAQGKESTINETREDQKSVVGVTQTVTKKASLTPISVSASIGVPSSYYTKIWHMRNPTPPGETPKTPPPDQLKLIESEKITEIQNAVVALLPRVPKGDDMWIPVKVTTYEETPMGEIEPPTVGESAFAWFAENWQTLGLFALAAFGVVFLRGMVRSAQVVDPTVGSERQVAHASTPEVQGPSAPAEQLESPANTLKRKFQSTGRSLREELAELVREDPDAAANVLKLWISDAA